MTINLSQKTAILIFAVVKTWNLNFFAFNDGIGCFTYAITAKSVSSSRRGDAARPRIWNYGRPLYWLRDDTDTQPENRRSSISETWIIVTFFAVCRTPVLCKESRLFSLEIVWDSSVFLLGFWQFSVALYEHWHRQSSSGIRTLWFLLHYISMHVLLINHLF